MSETSKDPPETTTEGDLWFSISDRCQNVLSGIRVELPHPISLDKTRSAAVAEWLELEARNSREVVRLIDQLLETSEIPTPTDEEQLYFLAIRFRTIFYFLRHIVYPFGRWPTLFLPPSQDADEVLHRLLKEWWMNTGRFFAVEMIWPDEMAKKLEEGLQ